SGAPPRHDCRHDGRVRVSIGRDRGEGGPGMNPSEYDDAYDDKQRIRGAVVTDPIATLKPKPVATVRPNTTVIDAVHLMVQKKIGCVCVTEKDKLLGIFTERDVLRKIVEPGAD